ncbi:tRNA (adenosine(37)-N6)-threonylcarbamoyltransferase complex ATPase subunit type 1 TsaE [Terriglobus roseus]|uniref:tRNA threonylcarbamoyladenosine biosynthesis protein TsaE n=1 Tax=Terriglobus roseus TaxID=392734 RepID=A0A1H4RIP1_9BACT|nr:tRNA (adenosine(37)-N6)-threonylcarbamoyltransferase complex ATPase subunit type 1 TsaE [Terriglobus roseus]SEC31668.1 tRNA threonylcarbamoyladenosine biosynthesis protein TsaE [Terriglobus roseus]
MIEKRLKTRSVAGTLALAQNIYELMLPAPRLVVLRGDLGAGKTTLVKGIAQAIGASADDVTSPTFTLVQEYQGTKLKLYHLDLYRLEKDEELLSLGIEEMEVEPDALVLVEWGEKFPSLMQRARGQVVIQPGDEPDERWFFVQML